MWRPCVTMEACFWWHTGTRTAFQALYCLLVPVVLSSVLSLHKPVPKLPVLWFQQCMADWFHWNVTNCGFQNEQPITGPRQIISYLKFYWPDRWIPVQASLRSQCTKILLEFKIRPLYTFQPSLNLTLAETMTQSRSALWASRCSAPHMLQTSHNDPNQGELNSLEVSCRIRAGMSSSASSGSEPPSPRAQRPNTVGTTGRSSPSAGAAKGSGSSIDAYRVEAEQSLKRAATLSRSVSRRSMSARPASQSPPIESGLLPQL